MKAKNTQIGSPDQLLLILDQQEKEELLSVLKVDENEIQNFYSTTDILLRIVRLRSPFIKMMRDISRVLKEMEGSIRGNIQFIVLSSANGELHVDFSTQIRRYIATGLNDKLLAANFGAILGLVHKCIDEMGLLCQIVRPSHIFEDSPLGKIIRSRPGSPTQVYRNKLTADRMRAYVSYHHSRDLARFKELEHKVEELVSIFSASNQKNETTNQEIYSAFNILSSIVRSKIGIVKQKTANGYKHGIAAHRDLDFQQTIQSIDRLNEQLAAVSAQQDSVDDLFNFMRLDIWKQRWRLYELWLLCYVVNNIMDLGAGLNTLGRCVDGKWHLKFSADRRPVARLDFKDAAVEIYYQLMQPGSEGADMPDIALRIPGQDYIFILDPKHGQTYSHKDFQEVCTRYSKAFDPAPCCIASYFPPKEKTSRALASAQEGLIIYNVRPEAESLAVLKNGLRYALTEKLPALTFTQLNVVILFDVSASTQAINDLMRSNLRSILKSNLVSSESVIVPFSSGTSKPFPASASFDEQLLLPSSQGTDTNEAVRMALKMAQNSRSQIWLFTDGNDSIDASLISTASENIRFVIFDYNDAAGSTGLGYLRNLGNLRYLSKREGDAFVDF